MLKVFSIYDSKAAAFNTPVYSVAVGTMIRSFASACNDRSTELCKHAGDFTLFELGEFDEKSGKFVMHETPVNHGLALIYVEPLPQQELPGQLHLARTEKESA